MPKYAEIFPNKEDPVLYTIFGIRNAMGDPSERCLIFTSSNRMYTFDRLKDFLWSVV